MHHKIHLDTDLGGDMDDLCALAMLLRWPDVEITGITTVAEAAGRRAGYVQHVLMLEERDDIPIAAGADVSGGYYRYPELGYPDEERYWSGRISPRPGPLGNAIELLKCSIEHGATIVAIGPFTNLYLLDLRYPGILQQAKLFLMGGFIYPVRPGFPDWGNDMDWNIQVDVRSARHVLQNSAPTLVPLTVTVETALQRSCLADLRKAGALGRLVAQQAEAFALDEQNEKRFGESCEGLPDDIINFLHDPLACAIALGYEQGIETEAVPITVEEKDGFLIERLAPSGRVMHLVKKVDGRHFNQYWLKTVLRR